MFGRVASKRSQKQVAKKKEAISGILLKKEESLK
jgi:hypothetical protein